LRATAAFPIVFVAFATPIPAALRRQFIDRQTRQLLGG